jgi:hypothetical protein
MSCICSRIWLHRSYCKFMVPITLTWLETLMGAEGGRRTNRFSAFSQCVLLGSSFLRLYIKHSCAFWLCFGAATFVATYYLMVVFIISLLHGNAFALLHVWWLLRTSVLKIANFALSIYMFFELWHAPMKACTSISCVSIDHTGGYAVPRLLQWETREWKFLPDSSKTRRYAGLHLFKYYGWSLEVLKPLFGTRGVTHPEPEPR